MKQNKLIKITPNASLITDKYMPYSCNAGG
jgi:hypothetical protein